MDAPKEQHLLLGKEMNALRCLFHQCNDCWGDVVRVLDCTPERCFGAVFRRLKLLDDRSHRVGGIFRQGKDHGI